MMWHSLIPLRGILVQVAGFSIEGLPQTSEGMSSKEDLKLALQNLAKALHDTTTCVEKVLTELEPKQRPSLEAFLASEPWPKPTKRQLEEQAAQEAAERKKEEEEAYNGWLSCGIPSPKRLRREDSVFWSS